MGNIVLLVEPLRLAKTCLALCLPSCLPTWSMARDAVWSSHLALKAADALLGMPMILLSLASLSHWGCKLSGQKACEKLAPMAGGMPTLTHLGNILWLKSHRVRIFLCSLTTAHSQCIWSLPISFKPQCGHDPSPIEMSALFASSQNAPVATYLSILAP